LDEKVNSYPKSRAFLAYIKNNFKKLEPFTAYPALYKCSKEGRILMIDSSLITRCQQGEESAFDALYHAVARKALWTAYLMVGQKDKAEDILQETFYICFRDIQKLRKPELFQAWFNRILLRNCWKVRQKRHEAESLDKDSMEQVADNLNVLETVESNQTKRIIRNAIDRLSFPMRTTIILYYYSGLSISEIANVMKCMQGTVKSRLHYAKIKLGSELVNDLDDFTPIQAVHRTEGGTVYE
jgi:RNA polymerase sigma-70 factor (ECF subfamily)